ncbi:hypothetical protein HPB47_025940 [Ixodes persulcatus]|uniref:Uncharacterized protein n=1 Tax=Ixodes persulcatus TaxID=34615 RepID=A0AC60Q0J5_IXOPE|nr:hypothetical protein HPB47_025940 [Ixodes persulcatus]
MPVDLYNLSACAPCALVRMVAKHIGVELNVKELNFADEEHLSPEYLKINPFHKVPTISDDGFPVYESTAICLYLLNKYAPDSDLYPKDLQRRARVDQVLATVTSFVQPRYSEFYRLLEPLLLEELLEQLDDELSSSSSSSKAGGTGGTSRAAIAKSSEARPRDALRLDWPGWLPRNSAMQMKKPTAQQVQDLEETALKGLEHLVGDGKFAVGDALTLADLTLVAHLSYSIMMPVFDREKFSKLVSYHERVSAQLPYFAETETITKGLEQKWSALK